MVPALPLVGGSFPWLVIAVALVLSAVAGLAVAALEGRMTSRLTRFRPASQEFRPLRKAA